MVEFTADPSHPRYASLLSRHKLEKAAEQGLLAESALIAHGRGEAFDYLLGEKTSNSARLAIKESAARLIESDNPVISVNGNTVVLAGKSLIRVAAVLNCPIEVNIYYRTEERISKLNSFLEKQKKIVSQEKNPDNWIGDWNSAVKSVKILGKEGDGRIQGLEGPRSICSSQGIEKADVILVPLEDGDRCEALVNLGKQVLVVDLNPLSRTAKMATITIVDEISRATELLLEDVINKEQMESWLDFAWNNQDVLNDALKIIADNSTG